MSDRKPTNPKDALATGKLDMGLVPDPAVAFMAMALTEGAIKYGRYNWRASGVRASVYRAAAQRHLAKWWNGEDREPATGVPHLASVMACIAILVDADTLGVLTDDRPPRHPQIGAVIEGFGREIAALRELYEGEQPHQYTIGDTE